MSKTADLNIGCVFARFLVDTEIIFFYNFVARLQKMRTGPPYHTF